MRVFDFDNTLYDGETMVDFFHFMVEKKEELKKYKSIVNFFLNLYNHNMLPMNLVRKCIDKYKGELNYSTKNIDKYVAEFWDLHRDKIMKDMVKKVKKDDVIITASLDFLLRPIIKDLPTKNIICTEVDIENKKVDCVCYKENKVKKYREKYKDIPIDELYTDSYTDKPLMQISKKVYLIDKKTKEIKVIKDEK